MKANRFVIRKSLIGKNEVITFINKKGDTVKYNHDDVYKRQTLAVTPPLLCTRNYSS